MAKKILVSAAKKILWIVAWMLCATFRMKKSDSSFFEKLQIHNKPCVVAFWHGSMLVGWFAHRPQGTRSVAALVSQSKDGEILSSTLGHWGYTMIRGSSHIGGKEAMQLMVDAAMQGNSLCITPDGPRGPRCEMKMGAVRVAQRAQVPLFLVGIAAARKKMLRSWDRFEIPFPCSKVSLWYSEPIMVSQELRDDSLDKFLLATQAQLQELNLKAEHSLSVGKA